MLSLQLGEEYQIYQNEMNPPEGLQDWVTRFPQAWAKTGGMRMARLVPPVVIELKSGATPIGVRQYPMGREAQEGISLHITRLCPNRPWRGRSSSRGMCRPPPSRGEVAIINMA